MKQSNHIRKPVKTMTGWVVCVTESRSPLSAVVERIECSSREQAWQIYREFKIERGEMI